jgi:hypothetical protein
MGGVSYILLPPTMHRGDPFNVLGQHGYTQSLPSSD